jgi:AcrR family transcriptional regulator
LASKKSGSKFKEDPRDRVFEAAMTAIAEHGARGIRVAHIAKLAGMSSGHVLYYFKSKEMILAETLSWSESHLTEQRRAELSAIEDAPGRLLRYIEHYVPLGPRDPRQILWLEVYDRSPASGEISAMSNELENVWYEDLAEIIALGIRRGEFAHVDPEEYAERFNALLGGFSMRVLGGRDGDTREYVIKRVAAIASAELGFRLSAILDDPGGRVLHRNPAESTS